MHLTVCGDTNLGVGGNFNGHTVNKQKKKMNRLLPLTVLLLSFVTSCKTQSDKTDLLRSKIEQILSDKNTVVGVSIIATMEKTRFR